MRVLVVHNYYGSSAPSGENQVVRQEVELLRNGGHEVHEYSAHSDCVRGHGVLPVIGAAVLVPWNQQSRARIREQVSALQPDVMHVHNVFPLLSPSIFGAASKNRTAVVNTLHNYRTLCPAAIPVRNGAACTRCIDSRSAIPSLFYGCYRNSRIATAPVAMSVALHRMLRTHQRRVDAFIALTHFQKTLLVRGGLPETRVHVRPNFFSGAHQPLPWEAREQKIVFIGRIGKEKGVDTLLSAWGRWGPLAPRLEIIGQGPDLEHLRVVARQSGAWSVRFLGQRTPEEVRSLLSTAKLIVIPSIWFEGFPLVLCEAFALGVPVAASRFGTFEELVESRGAGRLFGPGDPEELQKTVASMWEDTAGLQAMSVAARHEFESSYSASRSLRALEAIYHLAIKAKSDRTSEDFRQHDACLVGRV